MERLGGYYRVRQSDAHAWVEAELAPGKWYRFDPTQMVPSTAISFDTPLTAASKISATSPAGAATLARRAAC